ncbi:ABC transporter permease [Amycolatopsis regifaucium]|uniref:ABC transporter n=1 Tax=Amycolatopsis regifaucium TaxID=546365 RepID=A0A154MMW0_9PSEU|nr:ABC transporter permease [Amycolatopsis regifaucium]KZB85410.1 ABC transporter [Amycolatopsis regifaucium]OKA08981.1 ABC transporter [Amycolatopsis regifaucium]SFJ37996.1 ABC-2 type transport system permease protein [Amycolatopsis regifaucium]
MNPTYLKTEVVRTFRSTRFVLFAIAFPVLMFLLQVNVFGAADKSIAGVIMVNMMAFGAFSAAMTSGAKLAIERSTGWQRQLRLTPLTGPGYLSGKGLSAMLVALPSLLLVPLVGALFQGVHLDASGWLRLVFGIWLGAIPLVLLGLLLGQFGTPDSMQPVSMVVTLGMGFLGGLWIPIDGMPSWMADLAKATPTYWLIQLVRPVVTDHLTVSFPAALGVLAAWTAILGALVVRRYRKDSARV